MAASCSSSHPAPALGARDAHSPPVVDAKTRILARAKDIGFDLVGIADAAPFLDTKRTFVQRRDSGYLAGWHYPDGIIETNCNPARSLPGARSIICTATSYFSDVVPHDPQAPSLRGAVSNYAWGQDYHRVLRRWLDELACFICSEFPGASCLPCVDTGPLVDRAAAVRAGIGWFGKSANLLTREFGSYVFLAELITTLELEPDQPLHANCGQCVECVVQCPTGAILSDGAVDARRCISDLTQAKGVIPREWRKVIGNRLWGCDTCQTVCPVNDRKAAARHDEFAPLPDVGTAVDLVAVLSMTKAQFRQWFGPTAMAWRGKATLQRNAAVALGNSQDERAVAPLSRALNDRKLIVRGHAAWALGELGGEQAQSALRALLARESDAWVRDEALEALNKCSQEGESHEPRVQ
ncbi:MAG: tRNA epoxyqueuosine(34) reductase QueG [Candidatus Eremiobacteraeota bacterium]|nr:tRNA epoxyqueuosine(34) reductase QueG [Candidatus Eremiobacteraeota bacterium]